MNRKQARCYCLKNPFVSEDDIEMSALSKGIS
jgi:hypothetical protein